MATPASFEPSIDYIVLNKFAFEKFPQQMIGSQLNKSLEVIIGRTFQESLQKLSRV